MKTKTLLTPKILHLTARQEREALLQFEAYVAEQMATTVQDKAPPGARPELEN